MSFGNQFFWCSKNKGMNKCGKNTSLYKTHNQTGNGGLWKCSTCGRIQDVNDLSIINNMSKFYKRQRQKATA